MSTKNLLLISLDTLRADVAYSSKFPGLSRLWSQSVVFDDVVSSSPLTPPSHATILTGLQPYHHGIRHLFRESLSPRSTTLAERMLASSRRTGAFVSCPGLNRFYGMGRGFENYDDEIPLLADGRDPLLVVDVKLRGTALKRASVVVDRSIDWLRKQGNAPFFLFVHTFDAHWPYEAPEPTDVPIANAYEGEVAYVDKHISRLFDFLEGQGLLDDTLVVCLSDHGEDLGGWYPNDHAGERGHPEEEGHGALLYEATQRVPLMIRHPGFAPRQLSEQVRLVDVAPTILDLMGLPALAADGVSLVPLMTGTPALTAAPSVAYFETFFREELAQNNPDWAHLRALRGVRIDGRYKVTWEHGGEFVEVADLERDPLEQATVVFQPAFSEQGSAAPCRRFDAARLTQLPKSQRVPVVAWSTIAAVCEEVARAGGADVMLKGSLAKGSGDEFSDIDLELHCDSPAQHSRLRKMLRGFIASHGRVLALFPATHIPLPDLDIHFVEVGGCLVKLDIHYLNRTPHDDFSGGLLLVHRGRGVDDAPLPSAPGVDAAFFTDLHHKFAGWIWYTHGKIGRGELWEAEDSLNVMRGRALLPVLQFARGLPLEGCRNLETRLTRTDLARLRASRPLTPDANGLRGAMANMVDFFESLMPAVAAKLGREFRSAQLESLRRHAGL
jgi:arylsulfatase